jgi:hypothetical protein
MACLKQSLRDFDEGKTDEANNQLTQPRESLARISANTGHARRPCVQQASLLVTISVLDPGLCLQMSVLRVIRRLASTLYLPPALAIEIPRLTASRSSQWT